ncbi:MAG: DUF4258 domain-containing protein [Nanoarchaeota archaeon]|nr:DUF4258 domain-containing protein [Nanoarchaeota archaeon]MBU1005293.1 DUF4258 domain-containing protein [Nanoarchaeota archaeon]MBU1946224.1 DUF4258 domain-containing protein [Nanoarchaeota archaeon]
MKLRLSNHAIEKARERGISIEQIKNAIQRGAKHLQGEKIVSDYTYVRAVYKKIGDEFFVITVMVRKGDGN